MTEEIECEALYCLNSRLLVLYLLKFQSSQLETCLGISKSRSLDYDLEQNSNTKLIYQQSTK